MDDLPEHNVQLLRNSGGGPKYLGVACSCGWALRVNGLRASELHRAHRAHVRERDRADGIRVVDDRDRKG